MHAECEKILSTCPVLGCAGEEFGVRLDSTPAATESISQVKIETDSPLSESYSTKANSLVFKTNVNRGYLTRLIASQQPEIDELLNSQEFVYLHSGGGVPWSVKSPMKISVESIDELETETAVLSLEQFPHNSLIYMVCLPFCFICGTVTNGFLAMFILVRLINDNKLPSLSFWWLALAVYFAVTAICLSIRKTIAKKQFKKRAESVVRSLQDILNGNSPEE